MQRTSLSLLLLSIAASACGGTVIDPGTEPVGGDSGMPAATDQDAGTEAGSSLPQAGPLTASGSFTVMSNPPNAASSAPSYKRQASFSVQSSCSRATVGPCTLNPCANPAASTQPSPLPNAGEITIVGAQLTAAPLEPQTNGSYTPIVVAGQAPWTSSGQAITVDWQHFPGDPTQAGGSIQLASPPYVTLTAASMFFEPTQALSSARSFTVAWTVEGAASQLDQVVVNLTSGPAQLVCGFGASAGSGTVPAAAIQLLPTGPATYGVHSKEYASQTLYGSNGATWSVGFNVDAQATASSGLATGSLTIQ
jgi:hypothetical protein